MEKKEDQFSNNQLLHFLNLFSKIQNIGNNRLLNNTQNNLNLEEILAVTNQQRSEIDVNL